jgi:hypothetical protein
MTYRKLHTELKKLVEKGYGKPCKHTSLGCPVCRAHIALDTLDDMAETEEWAKTKGFWVSRKA